MGIAMAGSGGGVGFGHNERCGVRSERWLRSSALYPAASASEINGGNQSHQAPAGSGRVAVQRRGQRLQPLFQRRASALKLRRDLHRPQRATGDV